MALPLTPRVLFGVITFTSGELLVETSITIKPPDKRLYKRITKQELKMNKPTINTILTRLRWVASFLVLLFLLIHLIPRALGEREGGNRSSHETPFLKQHERLEQQSVSAPLDPNGCSSWAPTGNLN